jgi:hypothetical protein
VTARSFPPPWTIAEACFIAKDHNGYALAYVYFENEPGRRAAVPRPARLFLASGRRPLADRSRCTSASSPSQRNALNAMSTAERRASAARVKAQMEASLPFADRIVVIAGLRRAEIQSQRGIEEETNHVYSNGTSNDT